MRRLSAPPKAAGNDLDLTCKIDAASSVASWIQSRSVKILSVAGPRASEDAGIYKDVFRILEMVVEMQKPKQAPSI